jgi:hypothetical protein
MGDQRFLLGQFQLQVITQKLGEALFDLLGFGLGSGEPEELVRATAHVSGRLPRSAAPPRSRRPHWAACSWPSAPQPPQCRPAPPLHRLLQTARDEFTWCRAFKCCGCGGPLLADLDLEGAIITADALHPQTETARYIVEEKKADPSSGSAPATTRGGGVLGDIARGEGGLVLDPKGGLVRAILERLPVEAIGRTILVDPTDEARPVPLPLLTAEQGGMGPRHGWSRGRTRPSSFGEAAAAAAA